MREPLFTGRPLSYIFYLGTGSPDGLYDASLPLPVGFGCCGIAHDSLHQAVDGEALRLRITLEQGVGTQRFDGLVQKERIGDNGFETWTEVGSTLGDDEFGDGVGGKVGTETQELGSGWILLY